MSRKKTNNADSTSPTPMLNKIRQAMGYSSMKKLGEKAMPSKATKRKNTRSVRPKLISDETFLESKNIYLGTLILEMMPRFDIKDCIPVEVESR